MLAELVHAIYLGLGSNLGDREKHIRQAIESLESRGARLRAVSSLYETQPWGCAAPQPDYLNAVVRLEWAIEPAECMKIVLEIESAAGRVREGPNQPRPIDIDILLFGELVLETDSIIIPHPRMHLRRFVLVPLAEIAPELRHPKFERTMSELLSEVADSCVVRMSGVLPWSR